MTHLKCCALCVTLLHASACVNSPAAESLRGNPAPDQPPTLIDCADFNSPQPDLSRDFVEVVVPIRVDASGEVTQAGAPRASRQTSDRELLDRAVSLARSCSFEPATADGDPVPGRTEVRFRLGIGW